MNRRDPAPAHRPSPRPCLWRGRLAALALAGLTSMTCGYALAGAPEAPPKEALGGGVVSASHPLAAEAGAHLLEAGGNAVDAAAAIQFALSVVEPQSSGIGGGSFMMIHLAATGETFIVDSRERAPAAASPAMFRFSEVPMPQRFKVAAGSGLSVGVPGTVLGVATALERWGTRPLSATLAPAIDLAQKGFPVNRFLAASIANDYGQTRLQPETAALFRPGGVPLAEGQQLVQPDLARTLALIARDGPDAFYRGPLAQAIVQAQRRSISPVPAEGVGRMTLDDLAQYRTAIRAPVVGRYRGWTVATMPPPSSGGLALLQMLQMLERFPLGDKAAGFGFGAPTTWHVMVEAMRLAYADRAMWTGDPDFGPVPARGLLDPRYVAARAAAISPLRRMPTPSAGDPRAFEPDAVPAASPPPPLPAEEEKGVHTTHFSVVDRWGNVVSTTSTIETLWGTGITVPGHGFLLNNQLTDFNLTPTRDPATGNPGANDVEPFKRPRSSMTPTLLLRDGAPLIAYGSPGGATIINSVLGMTLNLIDHGMTVQQAIDAPRISVTTASGAVACEGGADFLQPPIEAAGFAALAALGHPMPASGRCDASIGSVQAVATGRQHGGADPRREGTVIVLPRQGSATTAPR
jgi:gamma-glutamyltranspeptidase/glutathione hydrolase